MYNYFLLNEALDKICLKDFKIGLTTIFEIDSKKEDNDFLIKHSSIWDLCIWNEFYNDSDQDLIPLYKFLEQIKNFDKYIKDEKIFESEFPLMCNGFLGIDFSATTIPLKIRVKCLKTFLDFKKICLDETDSKKFWDRRDLLYKNLILCGEVEKQISIIGKSKHFSQIKEKLQIFDLAVKDWKKGTFNHIPINENYSLDISGESQQTMARYGKKRVFSLPDGKKETFELHIKTGNLRFHFFPDNNSKKVYVGYIGPHLPTISN